MSNEPTQTLAVVFADVSGSVGLFDALGDTAAWNVIRGCIKIMTEEVERRGGSVVKTIGDAVMCTLKDADAAVEATVRMQERISSDLTSTDGIDTSGLTIRIGLNFGPVIPTGNDFMGDTVNVAARMASAAKGGQIITTRETVDALSPRLRQKAQRLPSMRVKGKGEMEIHEIVWDQANATILDTAVMKRFVSKGVILTLKYHDRTVTMDGKSKPLWLGRAPNAGLQVDDTKVSRAHARIDCVNDKFMITDVSANGTHLATEQGAVSLGRDQQFPLVGSGQISLGRKVEDNAEVVHYQTSLSPKA